MFIAASGLLLIGAGALFAYCDAPEGTVTAARSPARAGDAGGGVAAVRATLQQTTLPLALLDGGVGQLTDGGHRLDDGAHQLADGLRQARDGGQQLADGLGQLEDGVVLLGDGATQVSDGVEELVDRLSGLGEIQGEVTAQLRTVAETLAAAPDPASQHAGDRVRALVELSETQGLGRASLDQLAQLRDGARQLAYELTDPNAEFVAGTSQAANGSRQLRDGLVLLDDGGQELTDGTGQLLDGVAPVSGVVDGIAHNVRSATDAISSTTVVQEEPTAAPGDRQWWPYTVVALGAAILAAGTVRLDLR